MSVDLCDRPATGRMAANGMMVRMLQTALSRAESNANSIPGLIIQIVEREMWRAFSLPDEGVHSWNAAQFREFIESPRSEGGCHTPIYVLERMLRPAENEKPIDPVRSAAWAAFLKLTRGESGAPEGNRNAVRIEAETKYHDVILCPEPPATIPITANRKPPCGNSTSYVLRQLERGRKLKTGEVIPARPDLLERVKAGEITPHAAAVMGGFDGKSITIPAEPKAAVRRLVKHFQGDDLEELIRGLANWAGVELAGTANDND